MVRKQEIKKRRVAERELGWVCRGWPSWSQSKRRLRTDQAAHSESPPGLSSFPQSCLFWTHTLISSTSNVRPARATPSRFPFVSSTNALLWSPKLKHSKISLVRTDLMLRFQPTCERTGPPAPCVQSHSKRSAAAEVPPVGLARCSQLQRRHSPIRARQVCVRACTGSDPDT